MTAFGGTSKFGTGKFGGNPLGVTPGFYVQRMINAMTRFKRSGTTGSLETIDRLCGDLRDQETWDQALQAGIPAVLIAYEGGPIRSEGMDGRQMVQRQRYSVVCLAGDHRTRRRRLEGRNIWAPGLDNIARWVMHYCGRELMDSDLERVACVEERPLTFGPGRFACVVSFEGDARLDLYDSIGSITAQLDTLGITHTPTDVNNLFNADNITPKTDSPTSPATGYAELDEDYDTYVEES